MLLLCAGVVVHQPPHLKWGPGSPLPYTGLPCEIHSGQMLLLCWTGHTLISWSRQDQGNESSSASNWRHYK